MECKCSYSLIGLFYSFVDRPYFVVSWGTGVHGKKLMKVGKVPGSLRAYAYKNGKLLMSFIVSGYWYVREFPMLCGMVNNGEVNGIALQFTAKDVIPPETVVQMENGPPDYMPTLWTVRPNGVMISQVFPPPLRKRPGVRSGGAKAPPQKDISETSEIQGIKMLLKFLDAFED